MEGIFISYRRQDSADASGRIYEHLVTRYGRSAVFMDVDTIPYGEDFAQFIQDELKKCSVALVIIGPRWLDYTTEDGQRRLDNPNDFVRVEIETALRLGVAVVPVLVSGARMPPAEALPETLHALHRRNAAQVRPNPDFVNDMKRLYDAVDRYVSPTQAPASQPVAPQPLSRYVPAAQPIYPASYQAPTYAYAPYQAPAPTVRRPNWAGPLMIGLAVLVLLLAGFVHYVIYLEPVPHTATFLGLIGVILGIIGIVVTAVGRRRRI